MDSRKGAIELSVGTVVIIVLAMSMLILGIVLIRNIFSGATESVRNIDEGVKSEINKLFSDSKDRRIVLYPTSGIVKLEKGSRDSGFGIAIRNKDSINKKQYTYKVEPDVRGTNVASCGGTHPMTGSNPTVSIVTGQQFTTRLLESDEIMTNDVPVKFAISETAPTCTFRVKVLVDAGTTATTGGYESAVMDIEIIPK